jgi:hypothetical protein
MDVTPSQDSPQRPRAKSAKKDGSPKPARKTLTTTRRKSAPSAVVIGATPEPPLDLNDMIAKEAFYLAAARDFAPGGELDDWLEAERRVRARHTA